MGANDIANMTSDTKASRKPIHLRAIMVRHGGSRLFVVRFFKAYSRGELLKAGFTRVVAIGINFALCKLCCYSYLFSCVDVAPELINSIRALFFVHQ